MNDFNLDLDSIIIEDEQKAFEEACRDLDELDNLLHPVDFFDEAVKDVEYGTKKRIATGLHNTASTTRDLAGVYGDVTDAKANSYKGLWDLAVKCMNLTVKVVTWTVNQVGKIPAGLNKLITGVTSIPSDIRNKIKGNIKLYLTSEDFNVLYKESMLKHVDNFVRLLDEITKGDAWTSYFRGRGIGGVAKAVFTGQFNKTDKKKIAEMRKLYHSIQFIKLEETVIDMSDKATVDVYFGNAPVIEFTDAKGTHHKESYLQALNTLVTHVASYSNTLEALDKDFSAKLNDTKASGEFSDLNRGFQQDIEECFKSIAGVIGILGNVIKCITKDMNTINANVKNATKHLKHEDKPQPVQKNKI